MWDCVPVMLILILHYKNFQQNNGNELRKAALRSNLAKTTSEDIDGRQEVVVLDFVSNHSIQDSERDN